MNVLYLTMNPNRISTTVPTAGWFRLLSKQGLRPVVVSRTCGAFHEWCVQRSIPAYQNPLPIPSKARVLGFMWALWRLRTIVRRHQIQLIHCNEQDIYPIGQYLARLCRIPVVVSVHFTMERPFCEWAFGGKRKPDRMFFVSRGNLDACRSGIEGVVPVNRWSVLYNGLNLEEFRPDAELREAFRREHNVRDAMVIGVACALRPRKQLEHLLAAAVSINSHRLRVVVAGAPVEGDETYAENLLTDAKKQLGDRLIVLGHVEDLRSFYNGLDIFVNTSQEEACSISVMEALSCGCPVLGYASKSVDDQILPHGGEIVEQDNIEALTATLERWARDPTLGSTRRSSARIQAESKFDICQLAQQLWSEYQELLLSRNAPHTKGDSGHPKTSIGQVGNVRNEDA